MTGPEQDEAPPPRPLVAIVGRPNVGKSALFNRMVGHRKAIVEDIPGTTRDRLVAEVEWRRRTFDVVDTGGLAEPTSVEGSGAYMDFIRKQVESAIAEAALLLFVVDVRAGLTAADHEVADLLRRSEKPVVLVANKAESERGVLQATEFFELGLGEPVPISALNGAGVGDVLDLIDEALVLPPEHEPETMPLRVAVIGRPNVGKSALVNALLGEERVIVSEIAGTTRDAIDTPFQFEGKEMVLVDTAGIRRPGKIEGSIEHYSVVRAREALARADIAVAVFDAGAALRAQDLHIIGMAIDASRGLIVCGNKWDLVEEKWVKRDYVARIESRLRFAPWAPVVVTSALKRSGLRDLLRQVVMAGEERRKRVPTAELNALMRRSIARRPPPLVGRKRLKLLYVTEAEIEPPTFVFFVNDAGLVSQTYRRYLENSLRAVFGYRGTALRMVFRTRGEE